VPHNVVSLLVDQEIWDDDQKRQDIRINMIAQLAPVVEVDAEMDRFQNHMVYCFGCYTGTIRLDNPHYHVELWRTPL
jgi:hypothetical protein